MKWKKNRVSYRGSEPEDSLPAEMSDEHVEVVQELKRHRCSLKQLFGSGLRAVEDGIAGLALTDFVRE
jgi:hypothetical protein